MKRKCAVCRKPATRITPAGKGWCGGEDCGMALLQRDWEKREKKYRKEHREQKKALERPKDLKPRVQAAFNAMIRERDFYEPCISCKRKDHEIPDHPTGGKWDCAHFLSVGSNPELRFEQLNAHKQCKYCNRDRSGNATRYEENLAERIGVESVAWLKGPHEPKRYTVEQLRALQRTFSAELRRLRKEHGR